MLEKAGKFGFLSWPVTYKKKLSLNIARSDATNISSLGIRGLY
jgi:hypothetical protein